MLTNFDINMMLYLGIHVLLRKYAIDKLFLNQSRVKCYNYFGSRVKSYDSTGYVEDD